MSKTCIATGAMFDGLLKGIFVYNLEEAAWNRSRWDSSRLLYCPSGHSATCKRNGSSLPRSCSSGKCLSLDSSRSISDSLRAQDPSGCSPAMHKGSHLPSVHPSPSS